MRVSPKLTYSIKYILILFCCTVIQAQQGVIESLQISGNKKTKSSFIKYIAKVKENQPLDSLKIQLDIERIKRLDGVANAEYTVEKKGENYVVTYNLVDNFSIIPGIRIGEANDGSFAYRLSAFEFNGLGRNIIFGGFYQREVFDSYGIFLEHPYLLTNKLGLGANFQNLTTQEPIYTDEGQIDYNYTRKGAEFTLFYEHNFNNRFELGTKFFEERYRLLENQEEGVDVSDALEPILDKQFVRGSHEFIDIDIDYQYVSGVRNFFDATVFFGAEGELQTEYIFTNISQYFKRIGKKGNWASQLQLQLSNPVEDTFFVPIIIDNQLNTRGAGNTIDRGTASFALNTEYRHTLIEKDWFVLQSNTFVDASGLQGPEEDLSHVFDKDQFRTYAGLGLRVIHKRIFNAVLRFDYGFNLTNNGDNGFVFGIGQFF